MNGNRRWLGASAVRVCVLSAGLVLLAAGCMFFSWGSRLHQTAVNSGDSSLLPYQTGPASLLATSLHHSPSAPSSAARATQTNATSLFAGLPLIFEPNQGQANLDPADSRARFITHGSGYALFLGPQGAIINLRSKRTTFDSIRMKLAGANPNAIVSGADLLPGKSNYFLGNDPTKWRQNIPQFARVRYEDVYPGINLVFYGNQGHLEYDFQVAPGADPSRAELEFDDAKATAQKDGSILIEHNGARMRLEAPRVYQTIAGRQQSVDGHFVLRGSRRAGFAIGAYDHTRELVIDPILSFSTYFGGTGDEHATSVAVDGGGNIYLAGSTNSPNLATLGVFQGALNPTPGARNVYIAKINPTQNPPVLVYVTYLGGSGVDSPVGIAVDGAGEAFVAGTTSSVDFPHTSTAYQSAPEKGSTGTQHVFVSELNGGPTPPAASVLQYSSYLSGNGNDIATGMTIDNSSNIYVTGTTTSSDQGANGSLFPSITQPFGVPFQSTFFPPIQFFVTKVNTLNESKSSIAYSTYFGGANTANGSAPIAIGGGIAVDTNGNIYFDGTTNFTFTNGALGDFPILNAYQPCLNQFPPVTPPNPPVCSNLSSATTDAFLAKINPNVGQGEQLQWSSYFGGPQNDSATGIAVDVGATSVFITGTTNSPDITGTTNFAPFQVCLDTPVNPTSGTACNANVTATDAYVARLSNPALTSTNNNMVLNYFSYLGGTGDDEGLAITVDPSDNAYLTGWTKSTDFNIFPTPNNGLQNNLNGGFQDAFIAHLNTTTTNGQNTSGAFSSYFGGCITFPPPPTPPPCNPNVQAFTQGTSVALDVNQNIYFAGDTNSTNLEVNELQTTNAGGFDAFVTQLGTVSTVTLSGILSLGTDQTSISAGNPATFIYTVTNNGPDPAVNLTFLDDLTSAAGGSTGVTVAFQSATSSNGTCAGGGTPAVVTCSIPLLQAGGTNTIKVVLIPTPPSTCSQNPPSFNGGAAQVTGPNNIFSSKISVSALMSDFCLSVNPPNNSVSVAGGPPAIYQVQLQPKPVFAPSVSFSCTGAPTGATCSFTPTSVSLPSNSPGTATLTIGTTARPITTGSAKSGWRNFYALWIVVPGLALLGMGAGTNRRRRRILGFLMLCALFTQLLLLPACSGTSTQTPASGTQPGTYNITVSASSGTDTKNFKIQLTVP